MSEKYWNEKIYSILGCFGIWLRDELGISDLEKEKAITILRQIATDQREACAKEVELMDECITTLQEQLHAIRNAEIKG